MEKTKEMSEKKCTICGHKPGCKGMRDLNCDIYGKKSDKSLHLESSHILGREI